MTIEQRLAETATAHPIPGFVAAAVRDGAIIHWSARGFSVADFQMPMSMDSVFRLYSMTKAVTTVAVLQLVERGAIDLDAPASRYAPALADAEVLTGFDANGVPLLRTPKRALTMRHLLTHTSGLGYGLWNANLAQYAQWAAQSGIAYNSLQSLQLAFDPGEQWEYGVSSDWAGKIVENLSGQGLDRFFEENIFAPLGMRDTAFAPTPSMLARLADMHARSGDGALVRMPRIAPPAPIFLSGGGGLFGTPSDYLKFLAAIADDGAGILKPETVELMTRCDPATPRPRALPTQAPGLSNDLDLWGNADMRWSLGFLVNPEPGQNGRPAGSLAWAGLANTYYWIDRRNRLAGVFLTQLSPFADRNALTVFGAFERSFYQ